MPIRVECSGCFRKLKTAEKHAGRTVKCPSCGHPIEIPATDQQQEYERWLNAPHNLEEAIALDNPAQIARFIQQQDFYLIKDLELSEGDGFAAAMADVDGFPALLAFTNEECVAHFVSEVPNPHSQTGSVPAFVVGGREFLDGLEDGMGILLNPESDDAVIFPPEAVQTFRQLKPPRRPRPKPGTPAAESRQTKHAEAVRDHTFRFLKRRGFRAAERLPLPDVSLQLRPTPEIAGRLLALGAVFIWASAPEEVVDSRAIRRFLKQNQLRKWLTSDEFDLVKLPRADALRNHSGAVGWRLENMWPLAWALGFESTPAIESSQIGQETTEGILFTFLDGTDETVEGLLQKANPRSRQEVIVLEDRFYCAHNAVRSAQQGNLDCVPDDFDPIAHGGVIHERRHSLTWCLAPGTHWDETDLST